MKLEDELRQLFGATHDLPWPGEREAFNRFLRRRARRRRAVAVAAGLALVAVLGAAVLVASGQPEDLQTIAPTLTEVQVPNEGFELRVPTGWRVDRELTGTVSGPISGGPAGVVGVVLAPRAAAPREAAITVRADDSMALWRAAESKGSKRRADGRHYLLRPGSGPREVGQYLIEWRDFCPAGPQTCRRSVSPRVLVVTGTAAPGDDAGREQVLRAMLRVVAALEPITDSRRPRPAPTVPPDTRVLLGKGGTGRAAWEARIEPVGGTAGFSIQFPWQQQRQPGKGRHWESLEEESIQRNGIELFMDCLSWVPGSGLVLSGLAPEEVATVRIELAGRTPVVTPTFARDKPVPWVAFVSPPLPAGSNVDRVIALDAAGTVIGSLEQPYPGALCGAGAVEPP
ncbi:MAG TPA: hypothetical protein VJ735_04855 [Actinomycetes bacterium]|nr:hypothetical protein [Actinomycetes bacterium]